MSLAIATAQDTLGSGSDTLLNIENLTGSAHADQLTGNALANTLNGGAGADTLLGGDGNDSYYLDQAGDLVSETNANLASGGNDTVYSYLAAYSLTAHVENLVLLAPGPANGTGNGLANLLYAGPGNNLLDGAGGNDTVTYVYASAAITANLASGLVTGGSGSDTLLNLENLTGSAYNDHLTGNSAANSLIGGSGADTLLGGDGADLYYVDHAGDLVTETNPDPASGGNDTVYSYLAAYTLTAHVENLRLVPGGPANGTGNGLANVLYAGAGNNLLDGAGGSDTVSYAYAPSGVSANLASGLVSGGSGADTLLNIENLTGSYSNDQLTGNGLANILSGSGGADTMSGGDGADSYYVDHAGDLVIETNPDLASGGSDTVYSSLGSYTLTDHVENLRLLASLAANGTGNGLANLFYAGAGNNVLNGAGGADTVTYASATAAVSVSLAVAGAQATGGSGSDTLISIESLTGSPYDDTLSGNAGANTLSGGAGADLLSGGDGSDTYYVEHVGDQVSETNADLASGGSDLVVSSLAAYTLTNHVENLRLLASGPASGSGNGLANVLYAGAGDNLLDGAGGVDTVSYLYAPAAVTVSLAGGGAQATGGSGADTLVSIESLAGSPFSDTLTGSSGNNSLNGGGGNDRLVGGLGNDTLTGGAGADTLRFDTTPNATSNRDTISDFSAADDTIELEHAIFGALAAGPLAAGSFRSGPGVSTAADADDHVLYNTTSGALFYDADGSGTAQAPVPFATLSGGVGVSNLDFLVT